MQVTSRQRRSQVVRAQAGRAGHKTGQVTSGQCRSPAGSAGHKKSGHKQAGQVTRKQGRSQRGRACSKQARQFSSEWMTGLGFRFAVYQ